MLKAGLLATALMVTMAGGAEAAGTPASGKGAGRKVCTTTIVKVNGKNVRRRTCTTPKRRRAPLPGPTLEPAPASSDPEMFLTTPNLSDALTRLPDLRFAHSAPPGIPIIAVDDSQQYQRFGGIGVAMTDASAWLLDDELPASTRAAVMGALFGPAGTGIHLNFVRVPMAASDYTVGGRPYSYDEMPAGQSDPDMTNFSIAHDQAYVIPMLRLALQINPGMEVLANPWTMPSWMKANAGFGNTGGLGALLPSAYGPAAVYVVRFIQSYAGQGIPIGAITPVNEPTSGGWGTSYPGMALPPSAEANLVTQSLAPALAAAGIRTKIYGDDNSWDQLSYAAHLASSPAAADLAGISWHCYFGSPRVMSLFHLAYPSLDQIVDECSPEVRRLATPEYLIASLRNWATSVAVWNVALDPEGGPVELPNTGCPSCSGVVTVNEQTRRAALGRKYYQLGQVSEFVQPGAVRIDSPSFVSYAVNTANEAVASPGLDDVAFQNPDGSKVLVAYDNGPTTDLFAVASRHRYFTCRLAPGAMATFVWDRAH